MRLPWLLPWLALAASGACTPGTPRAPAPGPQQPSPAIATPPPAPPGPTDAAAAKVNAVLGIMSGIRSLPSRGAVRSATIDRATMIAQLKKNVREEIPPEALRGQADFLRALGLIPADFDFEQGLYSLLESQLAGYYDPDDKAMFLMSDLPPAEADATLAHELVHALQDQHYDLAPRMKYRPDANDAQSAMQSLAEGDATSAMLDYLLVKQDSDALSIPDLALELQISASLAVSAELAHFPAILRRSLVAPYVDGVKFVHALRRRGGWSAVDEAWRNLPTTTEQVLHTDKFDAREQPEQVAVPSLEGLGPGWTVAYFDIYGEQGLRLALEEWLPRRVAARAAEGWAGDHAMVALRHNGGSPLLAAAWRIRFDAGAPPLARAHDASEAFRALAEAFDDKSATSSEACKVLPDGTPVAVVIRDRDVVLVGGNGLARKSAPKSACDTARRWGASILSKP
jgi:hypothetical protein